GRTPGLKVVEPAGQKHDLYHKGRWTSPGTDRAVCSPYRKERKGRTNVERMQTSLGVVNPWIGAETAGRPGMTPGTDPGDAATGSKRDGFAPAAPPAASG